MTREYQGRGTQEARQGRMATSNSEEEEVRRATGPDSGGLEACTETCGPMLQNSANFRLRKSKTAQIP